MKKRFDIFRWAVLAAIVVVACFNYSIMFRHLIFMFGDALEDMSHGYVVPLVSLWVLWQQRRMLRNMAGAPSLMGAACVVVLLAIAWLGHRGGQSRIEMVSFIGLVWALPYAFWGRGVERAMRFPAAFLLFMVPISTFVDFITMYLRMASVVIASGFLNGIGMEVSRSGTALFSQVPGGAFSVDVAEPCSGIRSLFAMMALTAAYAYFTQKTWWEKWVLFACSVPIAMIGNMVRIMSICVVARWFGQEAATGYYHDYSGFVIFVVGVCLMFQAGEWVKKLGSRFPDSEGGALSEEAGNAETSTAGGWGIVAGVGALALAVFTVSYVMPDPVFDSSSFVAEALPERVGDVVGDVPWFCQDPQCMATAEQRTLKKEVVDGEEGYACLACGKLMQTMSLGEATLLPKKTIVLKRNYQSAEGVAYAVSVVVQDRYRSSIHRAELCMPSQGFILDKVREIPLKLNGRKERLLVKQINAHRPAGGGRDRIVQDGKMVWMDRDDSGSIPELSLIYWFLSRERECCSHAQRILTDVWDRSIHNRINRWVMIAVNVVPKLESPESVERFEAFLSELLPQVILEQ